MLNWQVLKTRGSQEPVIAHLGPKKGLMNVRLDHEFTLLLAMLNAYYLKLFLTGNDLFAIYFYHLSTTIFNGSLKFSENLMVHRSYPTG